MKTSKVSISWKIYLYMLGFIAVLLLILWIFQTVYLDEFYKATKMNELEDACENVEAAMKEYEDGLNIVNYLWGDGYEEGQEFKSALEVIGSSYDMCILITDIYGTELYKSEQNVSCNVHKLRKDQLIRLINKAMENDGSYRENFDKQPDIWKPDKELDDKGSLFNRDRFHNMPKVTDYENVVKVDIFEYGNGNQLVVMINALITPVDSIVDTIRIQLIFISSVMILLSIVVTVIMSIKIARPIVKINESATRLGKGDYDVKFEGSSYKEISELSQTLNQATIELAKTEALQKELIANVSHDLRTPLTMITAYSEVMRDLPDENTPENVQVVIDEAKRLTTLVNDLLDVSKLQAGVAQLNIKGYNLTRSIESVMLRYSKFLEQNGYTIDFEYDREVDVEADEDKIYQVIYNLVSNAINYTGEDRRVVVRQKVYGSIVRIEVIDTGEGIAEEELENVWERYYKVDKNHKRAVMGTGLGLSIVKNILKLHNVQFGVESQKNKGTCFWFELRIHE